MSKLFLFVASLSFLSACSPKKSEHTESPEKRIENGDYTAYLELDSCIESKLTHKNDIIYFKNLPFTGRSYTYYKGTENKMTEKQIFKGRLHGYSFVFGKNGDTLIKTLYQNGKIIPNSASNFECSCDKLVEDSLLHVKTLNGIKFTGTCYTYYDGSSQKYMEKHYKNGRLDGLFIIFDRQGNVLSSSNYVNGELKH